MLLRFILLVCALKLPTAALEATYYSISDTNKSADEIERTTILFNKSVDIKIIHENFKQSTISKSINCLKFILILTLMIYKSISSQ